MNPIRHTLHNVLENAGYETESYSGRGMYGETCVGVTIAPNKLGGLVADLCDQAHELDDNGDLDEMIDAITSMQTDSMGTRHYRLFPKVSLC